MLLPFLGLLLRLGSVLTINGEQFPGILLPKRILDELVPGVFGAFHTVDHYQMGPLFPLAVLACFGAMAVTHCLQGRRQRALIIFCIAMLAFEYYQPVEERVVPDEQLGYLKVLKAEPEPVSIINAPLRRGNSKYYLFYQTQSGFPQIVRLVSPMPAGACDYF